MKEFSVKLQNCYINIKSKGGEISGGYPYPELTGSISITPKFPVVEGSFCLTFIEFDDNYGRDYWSIKAKDDIESFLLDPKKYKNWVLWYYHDVHDVHNWKKKPKLQWTLTITLTTEATAKSSVWADLLQIDITINIYNKKGNRLLCERIG